MNGYVQLTPIPSKFFENNNVLDRMAKAIDGPDPQEVMKAWNDTERKAYLDWSGLETGDMRFTLVTGYPTKFIVFTGPWAKKGEEALATAPKLDEILDEICTGAVYGDTGTTLGGKSFSSRARWTVKPGSKTSQSEIGVTWRSLALIALVTMMVTLLAWMVMNG